MERPASPLKVVLVEDRPEDAELIVHALARAGFNASWQRVESGNELLTAVADPPDIIFADFNLPQYSALEALQLLREHEIDIPVIIVTGTVTEESAAEAMRYGAADYLLKDRLARVGQAVTHVLEQKRLRDEQRQILASLRESEQRYRRLAENAQDVIYRYRLAPEPRLEYINSAIETLTGYSPEECYQHPDILSKITHPEDVRTANRISYPGGTNRPERLVMRWFTKSGELIWTEQQATPVYDESGRIIAVEGIIRDITEREQLGRELTSLYNAVSVLLQGENLLDLSKQIVQAVVREFGQVDCGLMLSDPSHHKITRVARAGDYRVASETQMFLDGPGLVPAAVKSRQIIYAPDTLNHPDYASNDPRTRSELVVPLLTHHGVLGVLDLQSPQVNQFSERDIRILTTFAERAAVAIENMQLLEKVNQYAAELEWRVAKRTAELHRAKEHVEAILNNSSDAIIVTGTEGRIRQTNSAFEVTFGYTSDEAYDQLLPGLFTPEHAANIAEALETLAQARATDRFEVVAHRRSGADFDADVALASITESDGAITGIVCSIRDITRRKHLERELRNALDRERELNELKSRFSSMVSHEFRTPLAVIQSSTDLLRRYHQQMSEERRLSQLESIQAQVRNLLTMLDDLMMLNRADNYGLNFDPVRADLRAVVAETLQEFHELVQRHHLRIDLGEQPISAMVDRKLLRQILSNLLSNASKYAPPDTEIIVSLSRETDNAVLRVRDYGIGIPADDLERLFDPFHRAANVGEVSGSGLGLAIVKRAVEAHGGTIWVESVVGAGATFTVVLPTVAQNEHDR